MNQLHAPLRSCTFAFTAPGSKIILPFPRHHHKDSRLLHFLFSRRAIARLMSFSLTPFAPILPGSSPPWPCPAPLLLWLPSVCHQPCALAGQNIRRRKQDHRHQPFQFFPFFQMKSPCLQISFLGHFMQQTCGAGYNSYCFRLLFLIFFIMRAIWDFILFFVVVIIEIIRLIFEIDDCGVSTISSFSASSAVSSLPGSAAVSFASPERYFLPDLS